MIKTFNHKTMVRMQKLATLTHKIL